MTSPDDKVDLSKLPPIRPSGILRRSYWTNCKTCGERIHLEVPTLARAEQEIKQRDWRFRDGWMCPTCWETLVDREPPLSNRRPFIDRPPY